MADIDAEKQIVSRENRRRLLKAIFANHPTFYRFINSHKNKVRVYWLITAKRRQMYSLLNTNEFVDVNTFVGHGWMFEDDVTGLNLHVNRRCILSSIAGHPKKGSDTRIALQILEPVQTLKSLCTLKIIETGIEVNQVQDLCIPVYDKVILEAAISKSKCYRERHGTDCRACPLLIQANHFYHSKKHCPYGFSNYDDVQRSYFDAKRGVFST